MVIKAGDVEVSATSTTEHSGENIKVVQVIKLTPTGKEGIVLLENGDYKFGDLVFYPTGESFYRNGIRINVSNLECKLFKVLLQSEHCNLQRKQIIKGVWGEDCDPKECSDSLNSTAWRLRRALEKMGAPIKLECERGKGYELCPKD